MLIELNLPIRLALLVLLTMLTLRYSARGLQNGILLLLLTSLLPMYHATLIKPDWMPRLTLDRIVWLLVLLVFVKQRRLGMTKRCSLDLIEYGMFTLLVVTGLNMYFRETSLGDVRIASNLRETQIFGMFSGFALPLMAYFIMRRAVLSEAQVKSFLIGVGLITVYLGLTGIGEAWHQSWLVFPKYILNPHDGIHFGKVRGPFVQASWDGLAMAMGLPVLVWLLFQRRDAYRWLWLSGIILIAVSMPYVLQRAAWLSAVAALGVALLTSPKRHYAFKLQCAFIGAVLVVIPVIALGLSETLETKLADKMAENDNIEFRYELAEFSKAIIANNLLTGIGFERFRGALAMYTRDEEYSSHNTLLTLFAELGLVGFLPYCLIFACLFSEGAKAYRILPNSRPMIGVIWGVTVAYIIMFLAVELRGVTYVNVLFFALWGMLLTTVRSRAQENVGPRVTNFAKFNRDRFFRQPNLSRPFVN